MTDSTLEAHSADRPGARWAIVRLLLLLMAICFMAHFNRISITLAADLRLMEQYQISTDRMGAVYSAFLVTYTLFMIPAGWLIDRLGTRFALGLVCFGSAVFVLLTGCVGLVETSPALALGSFIVIRALMGIVSAPLHPAAAKAVSLGIPAARRAVGNGMVTGAALLGVTATYLLFSWLVDWLDWPSAFAVAALATAAVGGLWSLWGIDEATHAGNNLPPAAIATRATAPALRYAVDAKPAIGFWQRNKNLLLLTGSYGAAGYLQYLFFYWMHYYFEKILHLDEGPSRIYSAAATLAMGLGMVLGGWVSDRIESRFGPRAGRTGLAMVAMTVSSLLVLLGIITTEPVWIATWLTLAMGSLGLAEGPFWVTAVEIGGKRGGFSASVVNTGGNAGGILAPYVTPFVSDTLGLGWQTGIAIGSGICLVGGLLWYGIDVAPPGLQSDD